MQVTERLASTHARVSETFTVTTYESSRSSSRTSASPTPISDGAARAQQQLSQCMTLYAAATQHVAGIKIATAGAVELMGVEALGRVRLALRELVHARSERLIDALAERDQLEHEIAVKRDLVRRMHGAPSPTQPASLAVPRTWSLGRLFRRNSSSERKASPKTAAE